ncbi:MAG: hypothetical protein DRO06_02050 [Thermoproteota archaeon]|nr:MAG: hypothetical protein DRO06_02050 [Candidatus Korarchaeota archaeon]
MGWASPEERRRFYERRRERLRRMYWEGNDGSDLLRPNGFREYPEDVYDLFLSLIDRDGDVIDLGCGNGLMLRHLVERSGFRLIPHGVDFIEESIRQAREVVLPEYAENFWVANVADVDLGEESYDFIFFDPYAVHPADLEEVVGRVLRACRPGGKVIFYVYRDVLLGLRLANLLRLRWIGWVGDLLPERVSRLLERVDRPEVSVGVYRKPVRRSSSQAP